MQKKTFSNCSSQLKNFYWEPLFSHWGLCFHLHFFKLFWWIYTNLFLSVSIISSSIGAASPSRTNLLLWNSLPGLVANTSPKAKAKWYILLEFMKIEQSLLNKNIFKFWCKSNLLVGKKLIVSKSEKIFWDYLKMLKHECRVG